MDIQFSEIEIYAPKVEAAWTALQHQYASRITEAEIDHLFACFVFGLTSPTYAGQAPELHFEVCRALAAMKLPASRAEAALRAVPEPTQPWVASANVMIEGQGAKIGRTLRKTCDFNDGPAADADSGGLSRPGSSEDKAA